MATRYSKATVSPGVIQSGYEKTSPDAPFTIHSCGIEDVDRAFFNLFSEKLPLYYRVSKDDGEMRRVPAVFASGERFAVLSKSSPMRDKNGALILPMISISRTGFEFENTKGNGSADQVPETVIKKKLAPEDGIYQRMIEKETGLKEDFFWKTGRQLAPRLTNKNIYEVITIPTPKYFTAKYEVTIWCQYVQQLNSMIGTILGSYPQPGGTTIRIDTKKGYWFVAYFDKTVAQDNNFSDFSDSERLVKATLTADVPAYLILPNADGVPNGVKRYVSSPSVVFESIPEPVVPPRPPSSSLQTSNVDRLILNDFESASYNRPGDYIASRDPSVPVQESIEAASGISSSSTFESMGNFKKQRKTRVLDVNPITGQDQVVKIEVIDSNESKGEEVLIFSLDNKY